MTELRLFSDTSVMFNAQSMGDVNIHDPVVTLTGYIPKSMVVSTSEALKNRCKVVSDLRSVYHDVAKEYKKNMDEFLLSTGRYGNEDNRKRRIKRDMDRFFAAVNDDADHNPYENLVLDTDSPADITEMILRGLLHKHCHYVGFAAGESKQRHPARDPVMAHDKIKNGHIAVNRGGNVTVHADEQIDTGDYVVVDFDWKDFKIVYEEKKENDHKNCMGLKVKSFKHCAARCLRVANRLRIMDQFHRLPSVPGSRYVHEYTQVQCVIRGCRRRDVIDNSDIEINAFVKLFGKLAPRVIAQCKSGCTVADRMIDIKLESHIDKRSYHWNLQKNGTLLGNSGAAGGSSRQFMKRMYNIGHLRTEPENYRVHYQNLLREEQEGMQVLQENLRDVQAQMAGVAPDDENMPDYRAAVNGVQTDIRKLRANIDWHADVVKFLTAQIGNIDRDTRDLGVGHGKWRILSAPNMHVMNANLQNIGLNHPVNRADDLDIRMTQAQPVSEPGPVAETLTPTPTAAATEQPTAGGGSERGPAPAASTTATAPKAAKKQKKATLKVT